MISAFGGSALPVFKYVGMTMAVMVVLAALCMKVPPPGYKPPNWMELANGTRECGRERCRAQNLSRLHVSRNHSYAAVLDIVVRVFLRFVCGADGYWPDY